MSKSKRDKGVSRRAFLGGAGLSAGAAATAIIGAPASAAQAASRNHPKRKAGYRETEHVRRVYELSRF